MNTSIGAAYPGGPTGEGDSKGPKRRVRRLADFYDSADRRSSRARSRRTRRHLIWTFVAAAIVAGVAGWGLGRAATSDSETITRELTASSRDDAMTSEINRVLLELWKMEELEGVGNQ